MALVDLTLPDGSGLDIIRELQERSSAEIVVVTGQASVDSAVEALRLGAADYLTKPADVRRLRAILANVARMRELKGEISELRRELIALGRFGSIVGGSQAMRQVYELLVAATNQDPEQAITRGALRRDLFFRLNVFPIHLPPVREREDDVSCSPTTFSSS